MFLFLARRNFFKDDHFYTLELSKTTLEDSGIYGVIASNTYGSVSCKCQLIVDKGIRGYLAPEFYCSMDPAISNLKEGEELRLSAQVEAYPTVGVMWYRDGVRFCFVCCSSNLHLIYF